MQFGPVPTAAGGVLTVNSLAARRPECSGSRRGVLLVGGDAGINLYASMRPAQSPGWYRLKSRVRKGTKWQFRLKVEQARARVLGVARLGCVGEEWNRDDGSRERGTTF